MLVRDSTYSYSWVKTYLQLVLVKWVLNAKVLGLMGGKRFLGDGVLTRQGSPSHQMCRQQPSPLSLQFRLKVLGFWLAVTYSWGFLKLNFRQRVLKLEHTAKVHIWGSHFSFLFAFLQNCLKWEGQFYCILSMFLTKFRRYFLTKLPPKLQRSVGHK